MQHANSKARSNPFTAAQAAYAAMTPEEREADREVYERERQARFRASMQRLRETTVANRVRYSGIPVEYQAARLTDCPAGVREYAALLDEGSRKSLMMRGAPGTGKTWSACAVMIGAARQMTIRFTTVSAFLREVNGVWVRRDRTPTEAFGDYASCGLLTIDDVGKEVPRETSLALLWELIDARKANGRPTIYTTNYDGAALMERFAQGSDMHTARATLDRLSDSHVVLFEGKSMRRQPKEEQ